MNLLFFVLFFCIIHCIIRRYCKKNEIILTISTFLSKPNKIEQCTNALTSLRENGILDRVDKVILINEYEIPEPVWKKMIMTFPQVEFIQKGPYDKGQARTLNIILEKIKPYAFWIHWEESWLCERPFITEAIRIMRGSPDISQLQITQDWGDIPPERIINRGEHNIILEGGADDWPLFSLRPSINRVRHYRDMEPFIEDVKFWPIRFEREFGTRWIAAGCVKAVLTREAATRQLGHVSTYH